MAKQRKRNPKTSDLVKLGVVVAAGYGVLSAYNKIRGDDTDARTHRQKCIDDGGLWEPYPTFLPDETGTAGYCRKPGVQT